MKHLHSIRIAYENWLYGDRFDHLLRLLKEYRGGITGAALFTSATHSPLHPDEFSRRIEIISQRLPELRKAGFSAGINHLTTIGHHCEDLDAGPGDRYTYMTNITGEEGRGTYCMRDPSFLRSYVVPCYTQMAETHPDFIWVDDDVRYGHMPIGNGCFCDRCIAVFNETHGFSYTRETLRAALNENNTALRRMWLDHNSDAICNLFSLIAETVYSVDSKITLGFMTGERYYEGYQFARYADALSAGGTHEIMWRPGGGAYDDINFDNIVEKMEVIGRQNAYLPDYVTVIQSEIENYPYQLLRKTPRSTALEAAMGMTVGCTGAAFNILPSETLESLDTIVPHLRTIEKMTDFYRREQKLLSGLVPTGIHTGWRPSSQAACPAGEFTFQNGEMYAAFAREMFFFGLPEAYHPDHAPVTMMTGQAAAVMEDDEITRLLSGGVYLDVSALEYLRSRGFGNLLGFSVGEHFPVDAREQYTDHALNAGIAGGIRNGRQAFYSGDSYTLIPSDGAQTLSRLIDYHDRVLGGCACGIYENRLGGRICVSGYYPHERLSDYQKTRQLQNIFLWLSHGTLSSFVESYHRVRNITLTGEGRTCVTLFNISNDDQENVTVAVRCDSDTAALYPMNGNPVALTADRTANLFGGTYRYFTVACIPAFEGGILAV